MCKGEFTSCDDCCRDHVGVVRGSDAQGSVDSDDEPVDEQDVDSVGYRIKTEKVTHYYNDGLDYGLLVPYGNYYSGFGPQEEALHSVGFEKSGIPDTLDDASVRVFFYGKADLPELSEKNFYQDPDTGDTYLRLAGEFDVRVEADDLESETLQMVIETVYVGPSQEPEVEEVSANTPEE